MRRPVVLAAGLLVLWLLLWSLGPIFGQEIWFFHDLRHHHLPWRVWSSRVWAGGSLPLWAPIGHGYPLLADGQAGILYLPDQLLYLLLPAHLALGWSVALHQVLAGLGAFALARTQGRSVSAAMVAGVGWGAAPVLVTHLVYLPMFQVMAWLPWLLLAVLRGAERGGRWWLLSGAVLGVMGVVGHPQLAIYGAWAALGLGLWRLVELGRWRGLWGLAGAFALGVLLASPQVWATLHLAEQGGRAGGVDRAFAAMGSLPPEELVQGLLPDFFGHERLADVPTSYHHRAGQWVGRGVSALEDTFYLGVVTFLLALAAGTTRGGRKWWAVVVVGLLVMLGPATPFFDLYRHLPGLGGLRFPVRASALVVLAATQLAALGLDRLTTWLRDDPVRVELRGWALIGLSAAALFGAGLVRIALEEHQEQAHALLAARLVRPEGGGREARDEAEALVRAEQVVDQIGESVRPTSWRVLWPVLIAWGFAGVWLLAVARRTDRGLPGRLAWVFLAVDLTAFGHDFNAVAPVSALERPPTAIPLLGEPGLWRATVVGRRQDEALDRLLLSSNLGLLWGLEDVIVPSPLRLGRNDRYLAAAGLGLDLVEPAEQIEAFSAGRSLADLSGVRFLFTAQELVGPGLEERVAVDTPSGTVRVYENLDALPRAFVTSCTWSVDGEDTALDALRAVEDPGALSVVEGEGLVACGDQPRVDVALRREGARDLAGEVELSAPGWLVITESLTPGVELWVDGELREPVATDVLFAGTRLEAGQHEVRWTYNPVGLLRLLAVAGGAWLLTLAVLLAGWWRGVE
ncbi:MAG: hypothetical protein JXX28_10150 [Deltaproteobacteria bacterium]|nr:hypothetical protein [Deltaproteobacteria bacterium]